MMGFPDSTMEKAGYQAGDKARVAIPFEYHGRNYSVGDVLTVVGSVVTIWCTDADGQHVSAWRYEIEPLPPPLPNEWDDCLELA